jgi:hypothetical protein
MISILKDVSGEYTALPECKWRQDLECCILKLTAIVKNRRKKRKRSLEVD